MPVRLSQQEQSQEQEQQQGISLRPHVSESTTVCFRVRSNDFSRQENY